MISGTKVRKVEPDVTVVELTGHLNLGNTLIGIESSIKHLIDDGARRLVLDVAGLNYIDSAGIGMLVSCTGHIEKSGGRMRVSGAHGSVAKAFEVVHLHRITPLDADVALACANITAGGAAAV
jgi:anti-sigma B factor antagonist